MESGLKFHDENEIQFIHACRQGAQQMSNNLLSFLSVIQHSKIAYVQKNMNCLRMNELNSQV